MSTTLSILSSPERTIKAKRDKDRLLMLMIQSKNQGLCQGERKCKALRDSVNIWKAFPTMGPSKVIFIVAVDCPV